jgi:hypothetical protein
MYKPDMTLFSVKESTGFLIVTPRELINHSVVVRGIIACNMSNLNTK